MRFDTPINVAELPVAEDYTPIPDGTYQAHVKAATIEMTKAGTGQYIKVRFDIVGPSHAGRVVFTNLNIRNPNPKAEEIGRAQLGELARAIGLSTITDTDQLIGAMVEIKVVTKQQPGYDPSNEVKSFKAVNGSKPPAPTVAPAAPAATPAAPSAATPPWAKPKQTDETPPF
jgi:hypothetical protein